ncbi:TIR domain-containing protein [Hydrogenimonas cancrithermarum]|uniref:Nucleoside 2-deoxyribosyltransferase n=1 Tax=Hydrogenimonas cancrithermarum TaxID=2993563 RepID=A0ABN6WZW4_9BACT|nr:hypothetical protein [Hydrogenimonas cancrithermarum]BDY14024.1 hypothetical protein HCR_23370 [Hydrogenimonas cancrithermarum]
MPNDGKCPICQADAKIFDYDTLHNRRAIECKNCGKYYLLDMLWDDMDIYEKEKDKFYKLSSWIYEQNNSFDIVPEINEEKLKEILQKPDKKIKEKFECFMKSLSQIKPHQDLPVNIRIKCWIKDEEELAKIFQKALDENFIDGKVERFIGGSFGLIFNGLTFEGLEYIESLDEPNVGSKQVFAAFYFSNAIKEVFDNHVKEAIEECGLRYVRVSSSTTKHDTTINDEIIAKIKSSRLVIADFTGQRNSVYFEAGYAMGMGLPIIWTCKKEDVENLSFDTRQYPHILWEDGNDLKENLIHRIKVVI